MEKEAYVMTIFSKPQILAKFSHMEVPMNLLYFLLKLITDSHFAGQQFDDFNFQPLRRLHWLLLSF